MDATILLAAPKILPVVADRETAMKIERAQEEERKRCGFRFPHGPCINPEIMGNYANVKLVPELRYNGQGG
jgi:hypothetical protein